MGILGDSFEEAILELEKEVQRGVQEFALIVEDLWLDDTRTQVKRTGPVAERDSWSADSETSGQGAVTVVTGWQNFKGSSQAAEGRFIRAQQHFETLVNASASSFNLLEP